MGPTAAAALPTHPPDKDNRDHDRLVGRAFLAAAPRVWTLFEQVLTS